MKKIYYKRTIHTRAQINLALTWQNLKTLNEISKKVNNVRQEKEDITFQYICKSLSLINHIKQKTTKIREINMCNKLTRYLEEMRRVVLYDLETDNGMFSNTETNTQNLEKIKPFKNLEERSNKNTSSNSKELQESFENFSLSKESQSLSNDHSTISPSSIHTNEKINDKNINSVLEESEIIEIDSSQETYCSTAEIQLNSETTTISKNISKKNNHCEKLEERIQNSNAILDSLLDFSGNEADNNSTVSETQAKENNYLEKCSIGYNKIENKLNDLSQTQNNIKSKEELASNITEKKCIQVINFPTENVNVLGSLHKQKHEKINETMSANNSNISEKKLVSRNIQDNVNTIKTNNIIILDEINDITEIHINNNAPISDTRKEKLGQQLTHSSKNVCNTSQNKNAFEVEKRVTSTGAIKKTTKNENKIYLSNINQNIKIRRNILSENTTNNSQHMKSVLKSKYDITKNEKLNESKMSLPNNNFQYKRNKKENISSEEFNYSPDAASSYSEQFLYNLTNTNRENMLSAIYTNDLSDSIPENTNNSSIVLMDEHVNTYDVVAEHRNKTNSPLKTATSCTEQMSLLQEKDTVNKQEDSTEDNFADISFQNSESTINSDSESDEASLLERMHLDSDESEFSNSDSDVFSQFESMKENNTNLNKSRKFRYNNNLSLLDNIENYKTVISKEITISDTSKKKKYRTSNSQNKKNKFESLFNKKYEDKSIVLETKKSLPLNSQANNKRGILDFLNQNNFTVVEEDSEVEELTLLTLSSTNIQNILCSYRNVIISYDKSK